MTAILQINPSAAMLATATTVSGYAVAAAASATAAAASLAAIPGGSGTTGTGAIVLASAPTITGAIAHLGTYGQLTLVDSNYGVIFRNDDVYFYVLLSASGAPLGTWNALRPLTINLASGGVSIGNGLAVSNGLTVATGATSVVSLTATDAVTVAPTASNAALVLRAPSITYQAVLSLQLAGVTKWQLGQQAAVDDVFFIYNAATSTNSFSIDAVTNLVTIAANATILGTTASTSTTTGALTVAGGVGVAGGINAGGSISAQGNLNLTASASYEPQLSVINSSADSSAGYMIFVKSRGGAASNVGDNVGTLLWQAFDTSSLAINSSTISGTVTAIGTSTVDVAITYASVGATSYHDFTGGPVYVASTLASTSKTTGALIVSGGLGVSGALNAGASTLASLTVSGGLGVSGALNAGASTLASLTVSGTTTLTGVPTAPTATAGTNTTQIATTAFLSAAVSTAIAPLAPLASPALTGTPTAPTPASGDNSTSIATTAFVNGVIAPFGGFRNRIMNGDFMIDQRNNFVTKTTVGIGPDRWNIGSNVSGKWKWGSGLGGVESGFNRSLGVSTTSAYTAAASDSFFVNQAIEAANVADFQWGTANANTITVSFWVYSSLAGTFGGSIRNNAATFRSYPFTYTVGAASWTYISIVIPGDTSGTWVMQGSGPSVYLFFDFGSGSSLLGTAGSWQNGNFVGAVGTTKPIATLNHSIYWTGVQLEVGPSATPFERRSIGVELVNCRRYYQTGFFYGAGYTIAGVGCAANIDFIPMRATPTMALSGTSIANLNTTSSNATSNASAYAYGVGVGSGGWSFNGTWTANAEIS